jgi:hypothetical protein
MGKAGGSTHVDRAAVRVGAGGYSWSGERLFLGRQAHRTQGNAYEPYRVVSRADASADCACLRINSVGIGAGDLLR